MPSSVADRVVQARPDLVWAVVADVALYAQLATGLSHVEILEGDGQGLRRRCYDTRGRGWNETCTVWEPGRRFQMRVDTASYPFPLRLLLRSFQGTWSVDPAPEGARITVGFDAEPRLGPLGRLALRAMDEGLTAPPGYGYTVAEHARVVEGFLAKLGLEGITLMGQDWGGPIGLSVAVRHPDRFRALVLGNTFGWPVQGEKTFERFSKLMGSALLGGLLVKRLDVFTRVFIPGGIRRKKLSRAEKAMYRRPHPTARSRVPVHVLPREILAAHELLSEVEQGLPRLAHLPALIVWGDRDRAFKEPQRRRWEQTFPNHQTVILRGASHYIQEDAPEEIVAAIKQWWPGT